MINKETLLKSLLAVALVSILTGLICHILHFPQSGTVILIGITAAMLFTFISLIEIWSSRQLEIAVKLMWTTGFLVIPGLSAFLYFFIGRKRVVDLPRSNYLERS